MTIMAYQRIRQPKLSDVIEQELERLIVEGTLLWSATASRA